MNFKSVSRPAAFLAVLFVCQLAVAQESFVARDAVLKVFESCEIPSKASGVIMNSNISEGSLVAAGDLLMEIDSQLARLNVQRLENEQRIANSEATSTVEIEFMRRSIEVAKAELARAVRSNNRLPGAVPKSEVDQLMLVAERAIAEKKKTAFEMKMMEMQTQIRGIDLAIGKRQLGDHRIKTPLSGKVVEIYKRAGEWVDGSEAVARIVKLDKLKTEIKVPASIALQQLEGARVVFKPELESLAGQTFAGKVIFVDPEANPVNLKMRVWVEIDNSELKLVPGLVGNVELVRESVPVENANALGKR